MDSCDRIKIGDFGLATVHTSVSIDTPSKNSVKEMKQSTTDDRMTGKVGTAMYVAPELGNAKSRIKFSQKVDMYSLGVILFEMFYRPLETGMERVMVLSDIRAVSQLLDHYLQYYFHLLYDLAISKDQIGRKTDLCDMPFCV